MIIEKESKSGKYRSRFTRLSYEGENSTPYLEARGYLFPLALPHHGVMRCQVVNFGSASAKINSKFLIDS